MPVPPLLIVDRNGRRNCDGCCSERSGSDRPNRLNSELAKAGLESPFEQFEAGHEQRDDVTVFRFGVRMQIRLRKGDAAAEPLKSPGPFTRICYRDVTFGDRL